MNNNPLVSICCLSYNHESYLEECLNGFLMQETSFDFEVLIHDDASTDNSQNIIRRYAEKYPDIIKPIYQTENQYSKGIKVSETFNESRAQGKYIAWCEGDDYWIDPYKLQKQVDFLEHNPEYGLVRTRFDGYYETRGKYKKDFLRNRPIKDTFEDYLIKAWFVGTCTWLFRAEYTKSVDCFPLFNIGDLPLILEVSARSKVKCIDDITSVYRILDNSASHHKDTPSQMVPYYNGTLKIRTFFWEKYSKKDTLLRKIEVEHYENMIKISLIIKDKELLQHCVDKLYYLNYNKNHLKILSFLLKFKCFGLTVFSLSDFYLSVKRKLYL